MTNFITIYSLEFVDKHCNLYLPTRNDLKYLLGENEELINMLIDNKLKIKHENVVINSKKHRTALNNRLIQPVK